MTKFILGLWSNENMEKTVREEDISSAIGDGLAYGRRIFFVSRGIEDVEVLHVEDELHLFTH